MCFSFLTPNANDSFDFEQKGTTPMKVYKYGANVDTDVIIPARHLNDPSPAALASHCMEDIDAGFASSASPATLS